jgi:D-glycero-alpha-D-manno-heptose 1-phosphate guanylyltransferase
MAARPQEIPVLLLVGGLGTRLRPVLSGKPKPLAPIGNISFLELLLLQLRSHGFRNIVMCTGFQAEQIQQEFGTGDKWNLSIGYSQETSPLGTAGAIKFAQHFIQQASEFLVMNGDSFLELDLNELLRFHSACGGWASLAVRRVPDAARYGTVEVNKQNQVVRFSEKRGMNESGIINGGVYVFKRGVLQCVPDGPCSLEKDVLPVLLEHGVYALEQNGMFIDIGTPEDYARAQTIYDRLSQAALSDSHTRS